MKKLILIFAILGSSSLLANDLLSNTPTIDLISEAALESLERANRFSSELMSDDEGGWSGNGGGSRDESDNIWFIGNSPIKYCLAKSPNFPLKGAALKEIIDASITKWMKFFKSYELLNNNLAGGFEHPRMNMLQFPDGLNRKMSSNFSYTNDCDEARLQFLFGLENKVITNYKKFASDHPYGLAVRQKYDHKNFAHKGIIWIDQFSSDKKEIEHIVLHELGHIFGMKHDSVPVMDENLTSLLGKKPEFISGFLGKIEADSWTYGLKKDRPIVMTSTKGMRPRRRRIENGQTEKLCGDNPTYTANRKIPRKVLKGLNLNRRDCHKLSLTYLGDVGERRRAIKTFTLEIEELYSKRKAIFKGYFRMTEGSRPKFEGPGVVTKLNIKKPLGNTRSTFNKLTLEKKPSMLPLTGTFNLGREAFAAKMTQNKGLVIELFIPEAKAWWTFKTHYNQN